jgi:hypothetical protein
MCRYYKRRESPDQPSNNQLLKDYPASWIKGAELVLFMLNPRSKTMKQIYKNNFKSK